MYVNQTYYVRTVTNSHYNDVIMTTVASQITSLTVVYSTVYSEADQRKHQSSASLAFVRGIHRDRWIPRTKGQLRGKCFHLMTSSCCPIIYRLSSKRRDELHKPDQGERNSTLWVQPGVTRLRIHSPRHWWVSMDMDMLTIMVAPRLTDCLIKV